MVPNTTSHLPPELAWTADDSLSLPAYPEEPSLPSELKPTVPTKKTKFAKFYSGPYVHIQFDGGSTGTGENKPGECAGGYVIADVSGAEILRHGFYMGK